jgi:hypothetical protein
MPTALLAASPARLTRRAALLTVAVGMGGTLAGCTVGDEPPRSSARRGTPASSAGTEDPDVAIAAQALAEERSALDVLQATVTRHPELTSTLNPLVEAHRAHVNLLADAAPDRTESSPASASSELSPAESVAVPANRRRALAAVAAQQDRLSLSHKRHAFAARSGAFARLLASMGASAAQHGVVLASVADSQRGGGR